MKLRENLKKLFVMLVLVVSLAACNPQQNGVIQPQRAPEPPTAPSAVTPPAPAPTPSR